jgi:hypothetical protein
VSSGLLVSASLLLLLDSSDEEEEEEEEGDDDEGEPDESDEVDVSGPEDVDVDVPLDSLDDDGETRLRLSGLGGSTGLGATRFWGSASCWVCEGPRLMNFASAAGHSKVQCPSCRHFWQEGRRLPPPLAPPPAGGACCCYFFFGVRWSVVGGGRTVPDMGEGWGGVLARKQNDGGRHRVWPPLSRHWQ